MNTTYEEAESIVSRFKRMHSAYGLLKLDGDLIVYCESCKLLNEYFFHIKNQIQSSGFDIEICFANRQIKTKSKTIRFIGGDVQKLRGFKIGTPALIRL